MRTSEHNAEQIPAGHFTVNSIGFSLRREDSGWYWRCFGRNRPFDGMLRFATPSEAQQDAMTIAEILGDHA